MMYNVSNVGLQKMNQPVFPISKHVIPYSHSIDVGINQKIIGWFVLSRYEDM